MLKRLQNAFNSFSIISQRFQGESPKYIRGNVKGVK